MKTAVLKVINLSCLLLAGMAFVLPSTALAASKTYALHCTNDIKISGSNKLSCSNDITVQGIGSASEAKKAGNPYPDVAKLIIVSVDCGKSSPKDPQLGSVITSFDCQQGSPKSVKKTGTYGPIGTAQSAQTGLYSVDSGTSQTVGSNGVSGDNSQSSSNCDPGDALCAHATDVCKNGLCNDSSANPHTDCNRNGCNFAEKYINPAINLFTLVFGIVAVISIIMGGIQYSSSGGDPQKTTQAKQRISKTIIAVIAYAFLYTFLQFLVPGGLFGR